MVSRVLVHPRIVFHCEYVDSPEDGMYPRLISDPGKASDSDDKSLFAGMDYMTYTYEKKYNPPPITLKPEDGDDYKITTLFYYSILLVVFDS